jgi:hypothetical protein
LLDFLEKPLLVLLRLLQPCQCDKVFLVFDAGLDNYLKSYTVLMEQKPLEVKIREKLEKQEKIGSG